mgnify:CR=1 FL=1
MAVDVLAIGAHPDDAEIGCSGLLLKAQARAMKTGILVLTQGEMGSFGEREERIAEARAAAEVGGVHAVVDISDGLAADLGPLLTVAAEDPREASRHLDETAGTG